MVAHEGTPALPWLAIATVSYSSDDVVAGFLQSIPAATSASAVVVIADNMPRPGSGIQRMAQDCGATYLPMESNVGYGTAINSAIASLPQSVEWVVISNPDVILSPGAIDSLIAAGESDPRIGAIGPAILNSDGTLYPSARAIPSLRTGIGHAMFSNLWPANPWSHRYRYDSSQVREHRDAGWLSGSCLLVRKSAFDEIGGFDTGYFMYFEDVDLGYRLGNLGYRNVYEPSATATHSGAHATSSESAKMIIAHHQSARRFLAKKYRGPLLWPLRITLGVGLSIRSAIATRRAKKAGKLNV